MPADLTLVADAKNFFGAFYGQTVILNGQQVVLDEAVLLDVVVARLQSIYSLSSTPSDFESGVEGNTFRHFVTVPSSVMLGPPGKMRRLGIGSIFIFLMSAENFRAFTGDLQEAFFHRLQTTGPVKAYRWYYRQIFLSLWPLLWAWVKQASGLESLLRRIR